MAAVSDSSVRVCKDVRGEERQAEMRDKILELEAWMRTQPQVEIPLKHYFAPGLYLREMRVPKGVTLTGRVHKTEHYCIVLSGKAVVHSEGGHATYQAGDIIHAMPGAKRAIHALEDIVWLNIHHNPGNERDLEKIEEIFTAGDYQEFLNFMEKKRIEGGA